MDRDDVDWQRLLARLPDPVHRRRQPRPRRRSARSLEWYIGEGMHGIFVNGTTGEWFSQTPEERRLVAETAIDQVAGRVTVVIGCTSLHRDARRSSSAGTRSRPAPTASARRRRRTRRRIPTRPCAYFQDISDGVDGADDGLQLAARHERRHRPRPRRADRRHRQRRRDQGQHAEPRAVLRDDEARRRERARLRPVHERRGPRVPARARRRRLHRRRLALGRARRRSSGRPSGAATTTSACEHARRTDELFPKLWLPGRLGRPVRRLPEPAQGADEDARPARRRGAAAAPAGHRRGEPAASCTRSSSRPGCSASRWRPRDDVPWASTTSASASATWTRRSSSTAGTSASTDVLFDYTGDAAGPRGDRRQHADARASRCSETQRRHADRARPDQARPGARRRRAAAGARGTGLGRGRRLRDLPARARRRRRCTTRSSPPAASR